MKQVNKFTIVTLLLNSSLTIMVGSVIAPALPAIAENLHFKFSPGLLVTLPSLGVVVFSSLIGKLVNKLGPFKLISLGLIPYAILGFAGFLLNHTLLLMLDRFLLGAACVAIQVSSTIYIAHLFEGKERMKVIAWQGMAIELGGVLFLSLGGLLGEMSWQYPFLIYLIAILFWLFSWKSLPQHIHTDNPETSTHTPGNKQIYPVMLGAFFSMALFFVCYVSLPYYLPEKFGFSESHTGYFMSLISLLAVLVASQLTRITEKLRPEITVLVGFLFFSLAYLIYGMSPVAWMMFLGALATGIGFGFTVPLLNHLVVEFSSVQNRGKNLGIYSMMVFSGQFTSSVIEFIPLNTNQIFLFTALTGLLITIAIGALFKKFK